MKTLDGVACQTHPARAPGVRRHLSRNRKIAERHKSKGDTGVERGRVMVLEADLAGDETERRGDRFA